MKDNENEAWMLLFDAMMSGDPGQAIVNQEKRGQQQLVHGDVLPRECPREQLETLGFQFGDPVDDLFVAVTMPPGWKKTPTEHHMHSDLVDDKGRKRGGIFYKAAFYDRNASMHLVRRFNVADEPVGGYTPDFDRDGPYVAIVYDQGQAIWTSDPATPTEEAPVWELTRRLRLYAKEWLAEHYPDWEDPLAYWADPDATPDASE